MIFDAKLHFFIYNDDLRRQKMSKDVKRRQRRKTTSYDVNKTSEKYFR